MTVEQIEKCKRLVAEIRRLTDGHRERDAILDACDAIDLAVWGPKVVTAMKTDLHPLIDETTNTINPVAMLELARQEIRGVLAQCVALGMTTAELRALLDELTDHPA